jgi:hypothetical protein
MGETKAGRERSVCARPDAQRDDGLAIVPRARDSLRVLDRARVRKRRHPALVVAPA